MLAAESPQDQEPTLESSTFSTFGKQSPEDYERGWKRLVNSEGTGLKIKSKSYRPIPMFGTADGNNAMRARLGHTWSKGQEVMDLWDNQDGDSTFAGAQRVESNKGSSILLHTSGFYTVKV